MAWVNYTSRLKAKDMVPIPWMVAMALQADGWYLRSDIIWSKPNPMPESVTDRPTKAHEYLFLLSKRATYFYDADAIREQSDPDQAAHNLRYAKRYEGWDANAAHKVLERPETRGSQGMHERVPVDGRRNKRSVWAVATQPYAGAHFATFPPKLIEPCILAGAPERKTCSACEGTGRFRIAPEDACAFCGGTGQVVGVVLDPFAGSGTTGIVALRHNRSFVGAELNPVYAAMARERIVADAPLLNSVSEAAA